MRPAPSLVRPAPGVPWWFRLHGTTPDQRSHSSAGSAYREGVRLGMSSKNRRRRRRGAGTRKGMTGAQRAQIWRTLLQTLPPLIWALAALINVLLGR